MKNLGFGAAVLAVLCFLCFGLGSALACPRFVEFFSDPKDVPDQEGEFVEIRLDDCGAESLWVQMDENRLYLLPCPEVIPGSPVRPSNDSSWFMIACIALRGMGWRVAYWES